MKPLVLSAAHGGLIIACLSLGLAYAAPPLRLIGLEDGLMLEGAEVSEGARLSLTGAALSPEGEAWRGGGEAMARYGWGRLEGGVAWQSDDVESQQRGRLVPTLKLQAAETEETSVGLALPVAVDLEDHACWAARPRFLLAWRGWRWRLRASTGLELSPCAPRGALQDLHYGAGFTYELYGSQLFLLGDALGQQRPFREGAWLGELGLRWIARSGWGFTLGGRQAIVSRSEEPQRWIGLSLSWQRVRFDLDEDGRPDEVDRCPTQAEDLDGFEDEDGCPDLDNDQDRIFDVVDRCPNAPETRNRRRDHDGCPDVGDRDRDGHLDDSDECPNHPEDLDGYRDEDGCPDLDNDEDGVPDAEDRCVWEREDVDGFEDGDGCPDPDNDRDGIPDTEDPYPDEPDEDVLLAPEPVGAGAYQTVQWPPPPPTSQPASQPTSAPTSQPASQPTSAPTSQPASQPTSAPTSQPASQPASAPTSAPSSQPAPQPTSAPATQPAAQPTHAPARPTLTLE